MMKYIEQIETKTIELRTYCMFLYFLLIIALSVENK